MTYTGARREFTGLTFLLLATNSAALNPSITNGAVKGVSRGSVRFQSFATFLQKKQVDILSAIEEADGSGASFQRDPWERPGDGSFGLTTCIEEGALVEKGAASVSIIHGVLTEDRARAMSGRRNEEFSAGQRYSACALSLVFHPRSPLVPTFRADVRYFEVECDDGTLSGWFGGGADLTPTYLIDEDAVAFHEHYKAICDAHEASLGHAGESTAASGERDEGQVKVEQKEDTAAAAAVAVTVNTGSPSSSSLYRELKARCDAYFMLPARGERRGIGGLFFDDLTGAPGSVGGMDSGGKSSPESLDKAHAFCEAVADGWMPSWLPVCEKRRALPYSDAQRDWQLQRRGRYLEFNLLYDRGVRFGLVPGGRTEAVMVSAPPLIRWRYNTVPEPGSEEARLVEVLQNPKDWA